MTCVACEVKRARAYALTMLALGKTPVWVAEYLTKKYAAIHYVSVDTVNCVMAIKRQNTEELNKPYVIRKWDLKKHPV